MSGTQATIKEVCNGGTPISCETAVATMGSAMPWLLLPTAAATTGKNIGTSAVINMGGAAIGSGIKGEDPTSSMAGAGIGTVAGGIGGEIVKGAASKFAKDTVSDVTGSIFGGYISEQMGDVVKNTLDEKDKTNAKK